MPRAAWDAAGAQAAESRDKKQTALAMLFPGPARDDDDRFAAQLLTGIASGLGGRLFEQLRDKQSLCYTVHAFHSERRLAELVEFEDRIRAVTRERIRHVAERYLAPELRVEGVVRGTKQ